jgi:uncharacterized membrane protein
MDKIEFLATLRKGLSGLPQADINERLSFYEEMIDDNVEEGLTEEEAVSRIGSVDDIVRQTIEDTPLSKLAKERIKPTKKLGVMEIILLALGSPIWVSLLISFLAVIFSLYVTMWAVVISLWSVFVALAACAFAGILSGFVFAITGHGLVGIAMIATGLVCWGLSIFAFFGCKAVTKGSAILTKKIVLAMKNRLKKKGAA